MVVDAFKTWTHYFTTGWGCGFRVKMSDSNTDSDLSKFLTQIPNPDSLL